MFSIKHLNVLSIFIMSYLTSQHNEHTHTNQTNEPTTQQQGAAECTFEIGQGSNLTVLLDERLYKRVKAAAAEAAERFHSSESPSSLSWHHHYRRKNQEVFLSGGDRVGVRERTGTFMTVGSSSESDAEIGHGGHRHDGGEFCSNEEVHVGIGSGLNDGPLYNRYCAPLLDQFVKTQMLSHFLSEGTWE